MARELSGQATGDVSDARRLSGQLLTVFNVMSDGGWHTLEELAAAAHATTQSVSARIRDLRKPTFGEWTVERRKVTGANGLYQYRLKVD